MAVGTGLMDGSRDIEDAIAMLAQRLPAPLSPLARLAFNFRWSWLREADALFEDIDPEVWSSMGGNARAMLEAAPPQRLWQLARDAAYLDRVAAAARALADDLARPAHVAITAEHPVAYLCAEFGFHRAMDIYSGGLGILAGDILKAASDIALPLVAVGLFYRQGYFHQRLDANGMQHESWTDAHFNRLPAVRVTEANGEPLCVHVMVRGRQVHANVWRVDIGRTRLYLLDADRPDNHPIDRWITSRLYVGDSDTRVAQYALLGIGGIRALHAMGIDPSVVHLNEGHAALSSFERLRQGLAGGLEFDAAFEQVRSKTVFTTHTPVAAGNEGYDEHQLERVLGDFISSIGIAREQFFGLGRIHPGDRGEKINITPLALRTSRNAIGVSKRHGIVARSMWKPLWPELPDDQVPIGHVTNGVHVDTWMSHGMQNLLAKHMGKDWRAGVAAPDFAANVEAIPDEELWQVRCDERRALVQFSQNRSIRDRLGRGDMPGYVEAAASAFSPNVLTLGFARRVALYKRLYLLSQLPGDGLPRLLGDRPTAVQVVIAGKAHPADETAKRALSERFHWKQMQEVARRVVYLEDYDLHMAPTIMSGVDVWLNLPRPPQEASGTSGMKVVLNGGLNLSVMDGWWEEAYDGENGWAIHSPLQASEAEQDHHDAAELLRLLEHEVIPLFYDRGADGIPHNWLRRVKRSIGRLTPQFSAERMVRDYIGQLYS